MEAGTAGGLLYKTTPYLPYISTCWVSSICDFLRAHQIQLQLALPWNFPLARGGGDVFLMDQFRLCGMFSNRELLNLNAVRMNLQVATLSDITMADGNKIDDYDLRALSCPYRISTQSWIRQPETNIQQQQLWK